MEEVAVWALVVSVIALVVSVGSLWVAWLAWRKPRPANFGPWEMPRTGIASWTLTNRATLPAWDVEMTLEGARESVAKPGPWERIDAGGTVVVLYRPIPHSGRRVEAVVTWRPDGQTGRERWSQQLQSE